MERGCEREAFELILVGDVLILGVTYYTYRAHFSSLEVHAFETLELASNYKKAMFSDCYKVNQSKLA